MEVHAPRLRQPIRRAPRPLPPVPGAPGGTTAPLPGNGAGGHTLPRAAVTRDPERQRELERDSAELGAAILLASSGRVSSVVVCNLRHATFAMQALRDVASELGIDLEARARPNGTGTDIAVHRRQG